MFCLINPFIALTRVLCGYLHIKPRVTRGMYDSSMHFGHTSTTAHTRIFGIPIDLKQSWVNHYNLTLPFFRPECIYSSFMDGIECLLYGDDAR